MLKPLGLQQIPSARKCISNSSTNMNKKKVSFKKKEKDYPEYFNIAI